MIKGTKNAFTLAEVLITLGIIGVVAAMTMPTLLNSTQGAQYRTAFKKALSVLSQAVVLNVALDDYDLSQATASGSAETDGTSASLYNMFNNRMNVVSTSNGEGWGPTDAKFGADTTSNYTLFFNDGITLTFPKYNIGAGKTRSAQCTEVNKCYGVVDVNGSKNPNKLVTCDGSTDYKATDDDCVVSNPTDIYPIYMYDQTILPATAAARAVMYKGK